MDSTSDITIGQVVKSRAGRDKGNIFLVLDIIDDEYVYIVDGDIRKLDNPKKKKVKHLIIYNTIMPELKEKVKNRTKINNAYIRKLLEPFNMKL
ncbi:KOW domain-containing RNA-binding protein [Anaerosalibacter massiliensis]|uniref:KOW domain-containing RNA-binding protein n=1 Tax=Anaerosalibacter massiliensis TaxID=1347392 RepID=A0A9X2MGZ4_9FIRM|nr:KOW domain-containing RNA-binding protein [Anaerosalibacter massiliensis]MCR2043509.1 KOW domain-containing RNA-binding protein [Anaerosalibacter massiliensis]